MEVFDHLEWTYNGAFEELFGLGKGEFEQKFSKNSNARGGCPGRCLSFDLTGTLQQPSQIKPIPANSHALGVSLTPAD